MVSYPTALRSSETLGVKGACCLRCPDEPCQRFTTEEIGGGNTLQVCPVDAIHNAQASTGPTISDKCIQCGICVVRCPVGALEFSADGVVVARPSPELTEAVADGATFIEARATQHSYVNWDQIEWNKVATRLTEAATSHKQDAFYALVASLFTASGHPARRPARGDTSNRVDIILIDDTDSLPVEVKSGAESPVINVKSVQQALENRVVMDQRSFTATNPESSSLVVGYAYPPDRSDVNELIDDISVAFNINIGLISLGDLYLIMLQSELAGRRLIRKKLSELKGKLS